jgi:hypothetical protein
MKIVKFIGGLGNQMFQYAFYLALKQYYRNVKIDISAFSRYKLHNGFELAKIFNVEFDVASKKDRLKTSYQGDELVIKLLRKLLRHKKTEFIEPYLGFFEKVFSLDGDTYYNGYWQSYKYFAGMEEEMRKSFVFPDNKSEKNSTCSECMLSSDSVSIHVRLGDYSNNPVYENICNSEYYRKAIDYVRKNICNPVFYVFSDDFKNCFLYFEHSDNVHFVDWNTGCDSFWDMYLMSCCKHNIIANSSFSWWGAWLNSHQDKMIVAPKKWINNENVNIDDVLLPAWIKL